MGPSHESHLTESLDSDSEDWVQIEVSSELLSCFPEINSPDYQVIDCANSLTHPLSDSTPIAHNSHTTTTDIIACPTDYPISQEISEPLKSPIVTPITQEESSVSQPPHLSIPEPTKLKQPFEQLPTDFSIPKFAQNQILTILFITEDKSVPNSTVCCAHIAHNS